MPSLSTGAGDIGPSAVDADVVKGRGETNVEGESQSAPGDPLGGRRPLETTVSPLMTSVPATEVALTQS